MSVLVLLYSIPFLKQSLEKVEMVCGPLIAGSFDILPHSLSIAFPSCFSIHQTKQKTMGKTKRGALIMTSSEIKVVSLLKQTIGHVMPCWHILDSGTSLFLWSKYQDNYLDRISYRKSRYVIFQNFGYKRLISIYLHPSLPLLVWASGPQSLVWMTLIQGVSLLAFVLWSSGNLLWLL